MSTAGAKLPNGVAESWYMITATGEVYFSLVCRGSNLKRALAEMCFGSPDEEHEVLDKYWEDLCDPDFWWQNNDQCCTCSLACGEDPDIEIRLISDPKAIALFNANPGAILGGVLC